MTYPKVTTDPPTTAAGGVPASPRFPQIEERVLGLLGGRRHLPGPRRATAPAGEDGANEFVFYDGPPFANGLPHYGHLLTGYVKDLIPRYQTMRGRRVERRFGWDTHGLPAELEAMRQLGIKTKDEIVEMGIEAFNAGCRESVCEYTEEWRDYVTRQARWVDFDHDYKTLDLDYMESVMWAFKQLYDKGLAYEGFRVPALLLERRDPAVQPRAADGRGRLPDAAGPGGHGRAAGSETGELALIWTTTPWTLPSNLRHGRAPRHRLRRGRVRRHRRRRSGTSLGRGAAGGVRARADGEDAGRARSSSGFTGADLVGLQLHPAVQLLPRAPARPTGCCRPTSSPPPTAPALVHTRRPSVRRTRRSPTARASSRSCRSATDGKFTYPVTDYAGMHVFDANQRDHRAPQGADQRGGRRARRARPRRAPCCCGARPTSTPTRTAGAAASR